MKALLLHSHSDFELDARLPAAHAALEEDLGLTDVFAAMAGGDRYLHEVAHTVVLAGLHDPAEIVYRQRVLQDCIDHPQVARQLYDLAVTAIEGERHAWRLSTQNPDLALSTSVRSLEQFLPLLRQLRGIADAHGQSFASEGFRNFFTMLRGELDDGYLHDLEGRLKVLRFRGGVSIDGCLGAFNRGSGFALLRRDRLDWQRWLPGVERRGYTIVVPHGDDAGHQLLADLRGRGINLVANAVSQAADHVLSFFRMIRYEIAFYLACLNLRERLLAIGAPMCFPEPRPRGAHVLTARGLCEVGLALRTSGRAVGNDLDADGKSIVMITGANRGGKSTFLRSVGLAQLMMQCGLFVGAERFCAEVRDSLFTHFKRREDAMMMSGKLDEELKRLSEIADQITPNSLLLFNESFGATNEREGADIAEEIVRALHEAGAKVVFVTHSYELARRIFEQGLPDALFLRAERLADGRRTFHQLPGEPLATSFGKDLYMRIFAGAEAGW